MSYKILLVGHDAKRTEQLREPLERVGHRIVTARDAEEAVTAFDEERPDLVVIDSELRDQPAGELCRALKESAHGAETPIAVVSEENDSEQAAVAELGQFGCDLLIEKPVTDERLIDLCGQLLGRDGTAEGDEPSDESPTDDGLPLADQDDRDRRPTVATADDGLPLAEEQSLERQAAADPTEPPTDHTDDDILLAEDHDLDRQAAADPAGAPTESDEDRLSLAEEHGADTLADSRQADAEPSPDTPMSEEPVADGDDDSGDGDGLLDGRAVQSAMGRLDSILDESDETPDSEEATARARRASARGDFTGLLDEPNVDHPPKDRARRASDSGVGPEATSAAGPDTGTAAADSLEEPTTEQAVEAAVSRAFDSGPPADEGRDIEDHLDTLFSGGGEREQPPAVEPQAEASPSTGVAARSGKTDDDDEVASPAEPVDVDELKLTRPMNVLPQFAEPAVGRERTPAASRPPAAVPAEVAANETGSGPFAAPPAARELFDPADAVKPLPPLDLPRRRASTTRSWIYGVAALVVLIAAAVILLRGRDATPVPATADPWVAEATPPETTFGSVPPSRSGGDGDAVSETPAGTAGSPVDAVGAAPDPGTPAGAERPTTAAPDGDPGPPKAPAATTSSSTRPSPAKSEPKPRPRATETEPVAKPPQPAGSSRPSPAKAGSSTGGSAATAEPRTVTSGAPPEPEPTEIAKPEPTPAARTTAGTTTKEAPVAASGSTGKTSPESTADPAGPSRSQTDPAGTAESSTAGATTRGSEPATVPEHQPPAPAPSAEAAPGAAGAADPTPAATEPAAQVEDLDEPVVLSRVEPQLPPKALKSSKRATVVLKVLVNENGGISRVLVERGIPGSELEAAAISAVLRWKFRPATRNGEPIRAWTKATFEFGR